MVASLQGLLVHFTIVVQTMARVEPFIESGELPFDISQGFLQTFKQLFQGLDRVEVRMNELYERLLGDGSPTVQDELRQRFETYLKAKIGTRDPKMSG